MDSEIHSQMAAEVHEEIGELEKRLVQLRETERYHLAKARSENGAVSPRTNRVMVPDSLSVASSSPQVNLHDMKMSAAAKIVLRNVGMPMKTGDIAEHMIRWGFKATSKDALRNSLFAALLKANRFFRKVAPGTWELTEEGKR